MHEFLSQCERAVLAGDREGAVRLAREALDRGDDVLDLIENGFSRGIRKAGELWEKGEYFLPELAFSAESMKAAMDVLRPALLARSAREKSKGTIVIGTIQGDIHDIGKTLVATMLAANGYRVIDLGADVPYEKFIDEAAKSEANVVCMSALLTTTMVGQQEVIRRLRDAGLRDRVKVLVGGAPTSPAWAGEIGADGHADNAVDAVRMADSLLA
jgi:corrinoid protein of di/trimethylamine methyltransferase